MKTNQNQELNENNEKYQDQIRQIESRFLNFSNATKWIFYIPIGFLFKKTTECGQNLQIPINCTSVKFPAFKIGSTSQSFLGYTMDFSTRQNLTEKGLTISYLINEHWFQYLMLLKWFELQDYTPYTLDSNNGLYQNKEYNKSGSNSQKTVKINRSVQDLITSGEDPYASTQGPMVPCRLFLLDNFNNKICSILFQNSWLSDISQIDIDYSKDNNTEIAGTFQLKFSKYSVSFYDEYIKSLFKESGISQETF